jgi:hypothetical protein
VRKETFRSLGCLVATLIGMVVHRDEPERVITTTIVFCVVTVVLDYAMNRDALPKALRNLVSDDIERQRQAMTLRSQKTAEWLKGKRS